MSDHQDPGVAEGLVPGALVADRWELREPLSRGLRSQVWRSLDRRLQRDVALKVVRGEFMNDRKALRSFERQLELLGGVEDPHVMRIFDAVTDEGRLMLICELVEGIHLDEVLLRRGPLTATQVTAIGVQLAQGLGTMHRQSLVHRDVQPHNLVITSNGLVKLVGVGAVKWAFAESTITDRASLLTDAAYLAPEQLSGGSIDAAIDVYAAGLVLWQASVGRRPPELWTEDDPTGPDHLVERASAFRPDIPQYLDEVIWRATSIDPAARFGDGDELAATLADIAPARPTDVTRELCS